MLFRRDCGAALAAGRQTCKSEVVAFLSWSFNFLYLFLNFIKQLFADKSFVRALIVFSGIFEYAQIKPIR
ncbi:MAG: hypothetical protein A3B04_03815 [Candidatus Portnoybacteria bacterium RIFCSPLOWO2_02_FULL_39_11]|uniref:Uncharacterized protein n=1 Tax=Candidatus Portnoybacteria bacterium RIFCSPLOWO2_02_FULL_39_11 TaxID=1802001 RepID=A0A1G2FNW7_9BACT|nr:MAG: hypothetical protein A3B04_03815 [Candidatus Portnoybacteria bacterium RIFCSPLOWO2_02_FULL_39_11]